MTKKKNLKMIFGLVAIVFVLMAYITLSAFVGGNLNVSNINISQNMLQTRIVQSKLSELGFYDGKIDGVFDDETILALKNFQEKNGLEVTGKIDAVTTASLGVSASAQTNSDLYLLAKLIYSEARGEPYVGQVAVGAVVLNRVEHPGFPNTLEGVIYQPWAFTALHDGQFELEPNSTAYQAAQDAFNGWDPSYGSIYYYNPKTATSSWIFSRTT
ncbi:MAG: cell wall hydrolase, partial [Christensenellales bacterium]